MHRTDIGKYSFVIRTIRLWNKLPIRSLKTFPSKPVTFRKSNRKVISEVKGFLSAEEIEYLQEKGMKCEK